MRLCRYETSVGPSAAYYFDDKIVPIAECVSGIAGDDLLKLLDDPKVRAAMAIAKDKSGIALSNASLLVPIPRPNKIFLLAGNYAEHVIERGGSTAERQETFPYVFMKPPSTTLNHPGRPVTRPANAPNEVDWELELAVVIGKPCKNVTEADALNFVAGYTIINDITQRKFRPNPGRKKRERDVFFDWLHGKWFDGFCPCGPCIVAADAVSDPQNLGMKLLRNGKIEQDGNTGQMVFPVAAIIEFISAMTTLEPGDLISTGTPSGVGSAKGTYLQPGDIMHGTIDRIGTLITPIL
jgi:2,4-didehydro-3-deoxy-L-rhamnonate hydrolase